ncbi:dTDP-4-dehydrorhamnose reductase [Candidatus Saccharibacteria bacterium]|nr:dTDP-4-dehydrorhamnose reductase [Candidatus Saccharibacteria bacterium]
MRILITGAKGMLAQAIRERFKTDPDGKPNELILTDREADAELGSYALDITDLAAVKALVNETKPDLIINCAAYTNVDGAEQAGELAEKVNALGPENLAKAATDTGAILVHISTDYVFGGAKPIDEVYLEDDEKNPQSVYGKTKSEGEDAIKLQMSNSGRYYIFRTAWLYGKGGRNFVQTMIDLGRNKDEISVVGDQWGSPTSTGSLADMIYRVIENGRAPYGIYHATNDGFTNWADFAKEIFKLAGIKCKVNGISSEEYKKTVDGKAAPRPKNSMLNKDKILRYIIEIPTWQEALEQYLKETGNLKAKE